MQVLEYAPMASQSNEQMVVLKPVYSDPVFLYLSVNDLQDEEQDSVLFYVYTMGKRRLLLWGTYNKETH